MESYKITKTKENRKRSAGNRQNTATNMVYIKHSVSIISLNMDDLYNIEKTKLSESIKQKTQLYISYKKLTLNIKAQIC